MIMTLDVELGLKVLDVHHLAHETEQQHGRELLQKHDLDLEHCTNYHHPPSTWPTPPALPQTSTELCISSPMWQQPPTQRQRQSTS